MHECFISPNTGAADKGSDEPGSKNETTQNERNERVVLKANSSDKRVILLRTSAVKIVNPTSGRSSLVYAQHDTGSQVTLISDNLKTELGLETVPEPSMTIRTLGDKTVPVEGRTNFKLQSLYNGEEFNVKDALVVPQSSDDAHTLPHAVDTSTLEHFEGAHIPVAPGRRRVDVLIGQSDKSLLTVLEEREGMDPEEPNYVLTRLGPIASGGRVCGRLNSSNCLSTMRINVCSPVNANCECAKLKKENVALKQSIREYELQDEMIQPSRNDELAHKLIESDIKVKDARYEIPVPFNLEKLQTLPNNYENALNRTLSLRKTALRNSQLQQTLVDTLSELICKKWIEPIEDLSSCVEPTWYLPFFVTKSAKPRVVYDGAAAVQGMSLNQAVFAGENLLNNLVEVLTRFRLGKFACVADLSKCFFQVQIPPSQRNLFRLIWFKDNDVKTGDVQVYRFTRHVWEINSSPFVALLAIKRLIEENPVNASLLTLNAVEYNRYMDDVLLANNSLENLKLIVKEGLDLFSSRGFKLRKWVANCHAKEILSCVPQCDLATGVTEVDLGSDPLPDSKTLGLTWDPENDKFRVTIKEFSNAATRREMSSQLASQFDPLGMASPYLLWGKLILQKVATSGVDWDETLSVDIQDSWKKWLGTLSLINDFSIPRNCLPDLEFDFAVAKFQLHGFCDASDSAFSCVIYLRCLVIDKPSVSFVLGKSRVVLKQQANWIISRKELEAAKLCSDLMLQAKESLRHFNCSLHFWTDSRVVLGWITNADLHLARFVKRRVDKIVRVAPASAWNYIHTTQNPADVGTRSAACRNPDSVRLWLEGPGCLLQERVDVQTSDSSAVVRVSVVSGLSVEEEGECGLDKLIATSRDLYTLKKRLAYLMAFAEFVVAKFKKINFQKPDLNATDLDHALVKTVKYVQGRCFGAAVDSLRRGSPDGFDAILRRLNEKRCDLESTRRINELKTLRNLRPCVGQDSLFRIDGRLENAELPIDAKHPIILPGRHALTRLIVLDAHENAGHAGPSYTLMKTRQRFWLIHGISSVKHYIAECASCCLYKAKPIRQLMADLPVCRLTACNKPFKYCGLDYLGPVRYRQNRSECKAWGLLFVCMRTRCIHVELVTSLDLNNFLLAFTRFTNLRGAVDTIYSDNASTFCAASDHLPKLLSSTEFHNAMRKSNIIWRKIPPYAPSQGGSWESMVKLFKTALHRVLQNTRRMPSLIELQTFFSDAVRIVNDRPLTTLSDQPNDLAPISPSSFLGQELAPNTPLGECHDTGDLCRDYLYNSNLAHRFWLGWMQSYLPSLQGRNKWRVLQKNLSVGQLVLVGDAEDVTYRGAYRLGRIHSLHPHIRRGKEIIRRATVAVLAKNGWGPWKDRVCSSGLVKNRSCVVCFIVLFCSYVVLLIYRSYSPAY